jgi:holo-[acyl-carrier protein] synthase
MRNIGIDIEKISRFQDYLEDKRKYSRFLSQKEIEVFESFSSPKRRIEYLAGRFAAKEAIIKAVNKAQKSFSYADLSILNDEKGAPYLESKVLSEYEILLSLSHTDDDTIAIAVLK